MNILGVGGWELLAILLIMLIVAGPKRMLHWAYIMGQYIAKFRVMWSETVDVLQKEFDDAGVNVQIPKEPPTRANINQHASKALENLTRPVKDVMDETTGDLNQIKSATAISAKTANQVVSGNGHTTTRKKPRPPRPSAASTSLQAQDKPQSGAFGTWSGADKPDSGGNFGTWSAGDKSDAEE